MNSLIDLQLQMNPEQSFLVGTVSLHFQTKIS